jgi:triacylglycerol lipase
LISLFDTLQRALVMQERLYSGQHWVILLHGLARSNRSMRKLAAALEQSGYCVVNASYPSTSNTIQALAAETLPNALAHCPKRANIHFVTHSMGGILLRQYLTQHTIPNLGRSVMLAPPNQGSEVVDKLKFLPIFRWLNGPAGMQLGTDANSLPQILGKANFELGVIAGNKSINPLLSLLLPALNDGKVSVAGTKIEGMADHIVLPVTHPLIMKHSNVINQVLYFLRHGKFEHELSAE